MAGEFDPYRPPSPVDPYEGGQPPPPRRSNKALWIGLGGGALLLIVLCCGGIFALMGLGMGMLETQVEVAIRDLPEVQEEIGEIEECNLEFMRSVNLQESEGDDELWVYELRGSKGTGELTVRVSEATQQVRYAKLRTSDGKTIVLLEDGAPF